MDLDRNLSLYVTIRIARSALFWLPVFGLYFSSVLEPAEVLQLEALYYLLVVVLEVPSGYVSDRFGRRPTLIVASAAWALGALVIAAGGSFAVLAAGQALLAVGLAFQSGTDSSLLYETLHSLSREQELLAWETRAQTAGLVALGGAAAIGGFAGHLDLRLGHALTGVAGLVAVGAAWGLVEPPGAVRAPPLREQISSVIQSFGVPLLRYTLLATIALVVLAHVPYELAPLWIDVVLPTVGSAEASAPIVSGLVTALVGGFAAWSSRVGPRVSAATGYAGTLGLGFALLGSVMAAMAIGPSWVGLVGLLFRGVPGALIRPTIVALVHPVVASSQRATWLSVQSLLGRLAFAGALALGGWAIAEDAAWTLPGLQRLLWPAVGLAVLAAGGLLVLAPPKARARPA